MSVTFRIPEYLASFTGRRTSITLGDSPHTIGRALELLWNQYPGLHDRLVDEQGQLRPQLTVFIANDAIQQRRGLATVLPTGASVSILPALGIWNHTMDHPRRTPRNRKSHLRAAMNGTKKIAPSGP